MRRTEDVEPRARTRGLNRIVGRQADIGVLVVLPLTMSASPSRRSFGRTKNSGLPELLYLVIDITRELQLAEAEAKRSKCLCLLGLQSFAVERNCCTSSVQASQTSPTERPGPNELAGLDEAGDVVPVLVGRDQEVDLARRSPRG